MRGIPQLWQNCCFIYLFLKIESVFIMISKIRKYFQYSLESLKNIPIISQYSWILCQNYIFLNPRWQNFRCSYLENLDKHWYSISSKLVWKTQIHVRYNIAVFKNLIIKVLEMIRNFRKPLTLYRCMKKWYILQAFSIFSIRYKKWSIHVVV